ncbi:4Fe-4S binding protein [Desulfococcaceae bacterium HSG7]|nr:4Fe-4S binding protein [Desulfococcaceae bacterium HSG7]
MKLKFNHSDCSGCGVCKLACSIKNFQLVTPAKALLRIQGLFPEPGIYQIHFCDQCGECAEVCPTEAIALQDGIYQIDEDECTKCHLCVEACPHDVMIIKNEDDIPAKCVLCGECAKVCPREAIIISQEQIAEECE